MQYKDNKLVYNANGLLSAQQYGEQHDETAARKAKSLRKKLGLIKSEKEENMKKFVEQAADAGFVFLGLFDNSLRFVKVEEACDDKEFESKDKMEVYEVEREEAEKFDCEDCEEKFAWDELTGKEVKMVEDEDGDEKDDDKEDEEKVEEKLEEKVEEKETEASDEDTKEKVEEKAEDEAEEKVEEKAEPDEEKEAFRAERDELKLRCESLEKELKEMKDAKFKEDTDAVLAEEDEDMDEKDKEELVARRDNGEFSSIEEFVHEIAYIQYNKKKYSRKKLDYSTNVKTTKIDNDSDDDYYSRLAKI